MKAKRVASRNKLSNYLLFYNQKFKCVHCKSKQRLLGIKVTHSFDSIYVSGSCFKCNENVLQVINGGFEKHG